MASAMQKGFRESFDRQKNRPFLVHENTGRYRSNRPVLRYCGIVIFQGFARRNLALAWAMKRGQKKRRVWRRRTGLISSKNQPESAPANSTARATSASPPTASLQACRRAAVRRNRYAAGTPARAPGSISAPQSIVQRDRDRRADDSTPR